MRTRCASVGRNWSAHHIQAASRLHRVRAFGSRTRWKARTRAAAAASSDETQQQESDDHASSSSTTSVAPLRKRMREAAVDPLLVAHIRSLDLGFRRGSRDRRRGQRGVAPTMARRVPKWRRPKLLAQASTPASCRDRVDRRGLQLVWNFRHHPPGEDACTIQHAHHGPKAGLSRW
jgi:hypothetical protein